MKALNDRDFIAKLEELKTQDLQTFMELVLFSLKTHADFAVEDCAPIEHKKRAIRTIIKYFEEMEDYEDCAFLRDLQKKIDDAEKRQVSSDEQ